MGLGRRKDMASRPWRLSAKLLILSSVVTVIGFSAICASVMLDMRRGEEELARQTLENLASGVDADIGRNVELYDLSLRAVASNMVMPEINQVSKPIRQLILFDHAATAKHFGGIQVFNAEGRLTIDASTLDPVPEDRSDEEYFTVHRDQPDAGLFISRPMLHHGAYACSAGASPATTEPFSAWSRARSALVISTTCSAACISVLTTSSPYFVATAP